MSLAARACDRRRFLAGGAALLASGAASAQHPPPAPVEIAVRAHPIAHFKVGDSGVTRFGDCVFRGGLELASRHGAFGGFSGLAMDADGGGFLAVSDEGSWLRANIAHEGGRPVALTNCVMAPILGAPGSAAPRARKVDAESLCMDGGVAYVGLERVNEVMRFDWATEGFRARGRAVSVPPSFKKLPNNRGCEAIGVAPRGSPVAGALVAIAERSGERNRPTKGFILTGPRRGEFEFALKDDFDVTDLVFLPGGDLIVLERYYRPFRGVAMRIRRIDGGMLKPGALLDGRAIIEADMACQIDNMEALGAHATPEGEIVLTLLSDDNYSLLQRTLLLQFSLAGE